MTAALIIKALGVLVSLAPFIAAYAAGRNKERTKTDGRTLENLRRVASARASGDVDGLRERFTRGE